MSSQSRHRRKQSKSIHKVDRLDNEVKQAKDELENAQDAMYFNNVDVKDDKGDQNVGAAFADVLDDLREAADKLVFQILFTNGLHYQDVDSAAHPLIQEYYKLMASEPGQTYGHALRRFHEARARALQKRVQSEYNRDQVEEQHPEVNLRELYPSGPLANFWDELKDACKNLLDAHLPTADPDEARSTAIYYKLLQTRATVDRRGETTVHVVGYGLYDEIMYADKQLQRLHSDKDTNTHQVRKLYALCSAGAALVERCHDVQTIIARQPRKTVNGISEPVYGHLGDYVLRNSDFRKHRRDTQVTICHVAMRFPRLFGIDADNQVVPTVAIPGETVKHRHAIIYPDACAPLRELR
ncbi:uncharacterized protein JCM6883_007563 [Sporobolomyces salmoneus]|uniref:uncharacterized protein n=1 Tax=Sporobolomyces salmoneus TaxID=183962 RepID=UPI00317F1F7A